MSALARLTVLVVDDNKSMRTLTAAVLTGLGIRHVLEADDGHAALKLLKTYDVDLAIVDFKMAPMDGIVFTKLVRTSSDTVNPYLPIVMLTGHGDKAKVVRARDAGVTEFMVKPITAKALTQRIQAMILKPRPFLKLDGYFGPDRRRSVRHELSLGRRKDDDRQGQPLGSGRRNEPSTKDAGVGVFQRAENSAEQLQRLPVAETFDID